MTIIYLLLKSLEITLFARRYHELTHPHKFLSKCAISQIFTYTKNCLIQT